MMFTLAHYWGIDEIGVFVLPAVLAIVLLRWAERKARKRVEAESGDPESTEESHDAE